MVSKKSAAAAGVRSRVAAAGRTSTKALPAVVPQEAVLVSEAQEALMGLRRGSTHRKYNLDSSRATQMFACENAETCDSPTGKAWHFNT